VKPSLRSLADEDSYQFTLILDTVPPRITNHTPAGDITGTIDHVDVWFSERLYHLEIGPDVTDLAGNTLDQDRDGVFGEQDDDVYDATFNYVAVAMMIETVSQSQRCSPL
jgi:hypothetical protein